MLDGYGAELARRAAKRLISRQLPWRWTDDTAMAISIVELLERDGTIDPDVLAHAFARRFEQDPNRGYGAGAHNLFLSPDGLYYYVTNRVAGSITALDAATLAPVNTYQAPGAPDCISFSPDGRQVWFTQRVANRVGVLDVETGALLTEIRVGRSPHGILFHAMG